MRAWIALGLAGVALALAGCGERGDPAAEKAAATAVEPWLKLVDEGKYAESWDLSSAYFKAVVTQDQWKLSMGGVRKPLGKVVSRTLSNSRYRTSLPGAPDGRYVMLQFSTTYENKRAAEETVVQMLEADGQWKVSGYFIR